jgi:hypothetical protein
MDLRKIGWESVDLIDLAENSDQWQAVGITVINVWFNKRQGIS